MKSAHRRAVSICIIVLILCVSSLATGGLVVYDYWSYGGMSTAYHGDGPRITLCVDTHVRDVGVPFVLSCICDRKPYSLDVWAYEHEGTNTAALFIDQLIIVYPDGAVCQVVSPEDRWFREFE